MTDIQMASPEGETVWFNSRLMRVARLKRHLLAWEDGMKAAQYDGLKMDFLEIRLSYAPGNRWEPKDISGFMKGVRKELKDDLWGYAWVAERQEKRWEKYGGDPDEIMHYHVLLAVTPGKFISKPDKGLWQKGYSHVNKGKLHTWYLVKYLSKFEQKGGEIPKGMRLFACCLPVRVSSTARFAYDWARLPKWVVEKIREKGLKADMTLPARHNGVWYFEGEIIRSGWRFISWAEEGWEDEFDVKRQLHLEEAADDSSGRSP